MKNTRVLITIFIASLVLSTVSRPQQAPLYEASKSIALPGDGGYDYLYLDQENNRLYVSHGTTVQVIDLKTESLIGTVEGMMGNHGIAIVSGTGKGFISDGKANAVLVFDVNSFKTIKVIPLSGKKPDAITFDHASGYVFACNGGSNNISVIDVNELKEIKLIALPGGPEFAVPNGHFKVYNNIEDKNLLAEIDSKSLVVEKSYALAPCGGPTGLAIDSISNVLFTVCRENKGMSVFDLNTKKVIATIPIGAGVDAVAFDPATKLIFCSNGDGTTTIIRQKSKSGYEVVQTLNTQTRAKTLALDRNTHKIYLSVVDFAPGTKNPIPGSFKVLVYKINDTR